MPESLFRNSRPYGAYEGAYKDNVYLLSFGHVCTTPCIVAHVNTRCFAEVTLTACRSEFQLSLRAQSQRYAAVAVRPATQRFVAADHVRLVSLNINPLHRHFRTFRAIPALGVLTLDRSEFADFDKRLNAAYEGRMSIEKAVALHEHIFAIVARHLPQPDPLDKRIEQIIEHLKLLPECLLEELASIAELSYKCVSLLFGQVVGLPLRSYLLWGKLHRYGSLAVAYGVSCSMTEIAHAAGFVDSAHRCRTFQEVFGAPSSYFFANRNVRVFSWLRHHPLSPKAQFSNRDRPAGAAFAQLRFA